jgi:predicted nuclease of predicted toxin-antitoxin system
MKIKLDENIPTSARALLASLGHDADSVMEEGLAGQSDSPVWQAAQIAGRFFVTQDLDFSDLRRFAPGSHHGILLLRLQNPTREELRARLETLFQTETADDWAGCFVVATDHKVRVRCPHASQP